MENSLDRCMMYVYVCTHVELELKNPVGLLRVECSSGSLCEDCSATASNGAFLK